MHFLRTILLYVLIGLLGWPAIAQVASPTPSQIRKGIKEAAILHRQELYHDVLMVLQPLWAADSNHVEMNYYLGIAYLNSHTDPKSKALRHLLKVPYNKFRDLNYHMAVAYHYSHHFREAAVYYQDYLSKLDPKRDADKVVDTRTRIQQCRIGERMLKNPIEAELSNLGSEVNTPLPEYCPVVTPDGAQLFFTTRRDACMGEDRDPLYDLKYEDIFYTYQQEDGHWVTPVPLPGKVNTADHDAAVAISPDAQTLFLYKSNNNGKILAGDLYTSQRIAGGWDIPQALPSPINSPDWETHATSTADNRNIYFSSNRPGGLGGRDLYVVRKLPDGNWAEPQNLGYELNTPYDEESPFIHPNGKILYFSSKGHDSMGGYDIFYANWDEQRKRWSKPINIGYPINTADDDIYFSISADGTKGYFSSSREGGLGGQDLYMAQMPGNLLNLIVLKGKVEEHKSGKRLPAIIEVCDNISGDVIAHTIADSLQGNYSLFLPAGGDYGMRIFHSGYLFKSLRLDMRQQFTFIELDQRISLKPLGNLVHESLENIFFSEYGDLKASSDLEMEALARWIMQHPQYQVEVAVHDIVTPGKDPLVVRYMTQSNVDVLLQQLRELGVAEAIGKGYGFGNTYPISSNQTERGREQNRRIEYILRDKQLLAQRLAYEQLTDFKGFEESKNTAPQKLRIELNSQGDTLLVTTQKLLFALSGVNLDQRAQQTIEEVASLMEHIPSLRLEICGHTDNTGKSSVNMAFGQRRAEIILQQLVQRGIERSRLTAKSYGETQPEASNTTQEGRHSNRRVVFRISGSIPRQLIQHTL